MGSQVVCRHPLGMNLTGTAQQRTKHTIRQRHKYTQRHQPQHLARAPSPDSLPKTSDLAHIRPHFSPYSPPTIPIYLSPLHRHKHPTLQSLPTIPIYCLLCIDTNTLHYSPSLLYLYILSRLHRHKRPTSYLYYPPCTTYIRLLHFRVECASCKRYILYLQKQKLWKLWKRKIETNL